MLSLGRENWEEPNPLTGNNMESVISVACGDLDLFIVDRYQPFLLRERAQCLKVVLFSFCSFPKALSSLA